MTFDTVILLLYAQVLIGLHELQCADTPVYNYPLVNTTGTAEVVYGGYSGYEGLGAVTAFSPHPSIENAPLYFFGSDYSYAELKLGEEAALTNDWSFNMFVYSIAPHTGTIFDLVYDGNTQLPDSLFSSRVKLQLNGSHIILEMLGPSGEDYGSAVVGTIFTAEMWIPLGLVHDKSNGDVTLQTLGIKFYESKDFQDNPNHIKLPQPAKIKIAGAFNESSPFKGSVVCFTVYDKTVSTLSFVSTYIDCGPSNWPVTPPEIDISNTTIPQTCYPEYKGYFTAVGKDTKPATLSTIVIATNTSSSTYCGHICLTMVECSSFTFNKSNSLCTLYTGFQDPNTESHAGTHYYIRKDLC